VLRCVCHCRCAVFRMEETHLDTRLIIYLCRFGPVLVASAALYSDGFRFRCPLTVHSGAGSLVQGWLSSPGIEEWHIRGMPVRAATQRELRFTVKPSAYVRVQKAGLRVAVPWHGSFKLFMDRKPVILGGLGGPGAPETFPKGGGLRPRPSKNLRGPRGRQGPPRPLPRVSGPPGTAQTCKINDFLNIFHIIPIAIQSAATQ
jgi:hypothetical protein